MREVRRTVSVRVTGVGVSGDSVLQAYRLLVILCEPLKVDSYRSGCAVAQQQSLESVRAHLCVDRRVLRR